jgi:hypothetical protein
MSRSSDYISACNERATVVVTNFMCHGQATVPGMNLDSRFLVKDPARTSLS